MAIVVKLKNSSSNQAWFHWLHNRIQEYYVLCNAVSSPFGMSSFAHCCSRETKVEEPVGMTRPDEDQKPRLQFHMPFPCSSPSPGKGGLLQIEISSGTTQDGTDYSRISKCL